MGDPEGRRGGVSVQTLPDSTTVYVEGHGVSTLGEIRHTPEEDPAPTLEEATIAMWVDIGTRNLNRQPWEQPATPSEVRAFHVSRYIAAQARRRRT